MLKKLKKIPSQTKLAIAVVLAMILAGVYYFVLIKGSEKKAAELNSQISAVQTEIDAAQAELDSINARKAAIEEGKKLRSAVQPYDNSNAEWAYLSEKLKQYTTTFALSFSEAKKGEEYYARRNVRVSFNAQDLESSRSALDAIADCRYRSLVTNLSLKAGANGLNGGGTISGSLDVTFIESLPLKSAKSSETAAE